MAIEIFVQRQRVRGVPLEAVHRPESSDGRVEVIPHTGSRGGLRAERLGGVRVELGEEQRPQHPEQDRNPADHGVML